MKIRVSQDILKANDLVAADVRGRLRSAGVYTVNLLGSPGSGKTTLLEVTLPLLAAAGLRAAVVEGDVQTALDGERIEALGVPVVQLNTMGGCHLGAPMIADAIDEFDLGATDLLFVENVGNLVCTASFDLGEDAKVTVLSVTEGDDKVRKYPTIFSNSRILVLSKTDLLPHVDFDPDRAEADARAISPGIEVVHVSARTGDGVDDWVRLLRDRISS